jgi:phytoene dehydrogenase-like protein
VSYDAIVIGAGHNALVCACYLARGGMRVLVVERRGTAGGMAQTSDLLPGVRVPTLAHTVGRFRREIVDELRLADRGLELIEPDVRVFAPQLDGPGLTLPTTDSDAYTRADSRYRQLAGALATLMAGAPPDLAALSIADVQLGSEVADLATVLPMSVADLVGEWFDDDAMRAAIAARGVLYTGFGPLAPGTAQVLIADGAGNDGGLAGQTVFARGGPRSVGDALASAARSLGVEIRLGAQVVAVRNRGESVTGLALSDGEEIEAGVVVSGADPKSTLLKLVAPEALGPRLGWRAGNIRSNGATAKVNLALSGLPKFGIDEERLRGRILIAPSMKALIAATTPFKYGQMPDEPLLEATIPTLTDSTLLDENRTGKAKDVAHVMSVVVQAVPAATPHGAVANAVMKTLDRYAPGISDLVVERRVLTPADIEREYGAMGGHAMHAEVDLAQWFAWRPLHGYGRHRMPLAGLYLAGSGAHPGGGVTGGPGRLAAQEVLSDWRARQ